jgi:Carboxypeptidase regulatory-like domain/TonB-dependent Receptor Plug Domain
MKRVLLAALVMLVTASAAFAQLGGGTLSGTVTDEQGAVLPGVTVTAIGSDRTVTAITNEAGKFRFLNLAPGQYKVSIALQGFATAVRDKIDVRVGATTDLPAMPMRVAAVSESIEVKGDSPIVDTKAMGTATNFTSDELQKIPTSRDPFALMRSVPGVLVDRVNIGGNETGQQSNFAAKGTRPQDASWTLDGVEVTDMAATGASPTYFNYDNFDEIQVSTAGNDIKARTGGMGLNFVVRRGTNQYRGNVRGYFDNDSMESSNVPDELKAQGVTHDTSDHNKQISDYGGEIGGPIVRDKAWFYASYSIQDVRLVRRAGALIDRTQLKDPNVKVNWQATSKDNLSFLYLDGFKIKDGRSPGITGITFDAPSATYHQDNAYTDTPLHGLWKIADDHVFGSKLYVSGLYAYYNTGFILDPLGGLDQQAGRNFVTAQSYGSVNQTINIRPQHTATVDAQSFLNGFGGSHSVKYGFGWRRVEATAGSLWPGNMILANERAGNLQAQVFRQGLGGNRAKYVDFYVGDTLSRDRWTIDAGLRYDRQNGEALPSRTLANAAFPDLVPGVVFDGYKSPFTWNNWSPRIGATYALDDSRKTILRGSYSRSAGQLNTGTVGVLNLTSTAGSATYGWVDLNNDHFAQADEVQLNNFISSAGGFNPNNPTAGTSANVLDPNLKAPVTASFVAGIEREVMPNLAVAVNYTYTRTTDLFGNFTGTITPRVGVTLADYTPGSGYSGTIPLEGGVAFNVPTFIPNAAAIAAGGNGFVTTNIPGFFTDYHGLELSMNKRLANRWMGHVGFSWNNAREHFDSPSGVYDTNGNPTPTVTEPLKDGGQFAPQSGGSGSGTIYINAKWQVNANALYQAKYGLELSANVFGRQGYPFPVVRGGTSAALGNDSALTVLLSPEIDTFRFPDLWNTDIRVARAFKPGGQSNLRLMLDVFNLFNANTALVRVNDLTSTRFNALAQNLSPRIARVGVILGF